MDILTDSHHVSRLEVVDTGRRRRWLQAEKLRQLMDAARHLFSVVIVDQPRILQFLRHAVVCATTMLNEGGLRRTRLQCARGWRQNAIALKVNGSATLISLSST